MTNLSADAIRLTRGVPVSEVYTVTASTTIYRGSLVCVSTATGLAVVGASAANRKFVGLAQQQVVQTASSTYQVVCEYGHEALFDCKAEVTVALIGADLCISDSNVLSTSAEVAANQVTVGEMISLPATQKAWVAVRRYCGVVS